MANEKKKMTIRSSAERIDELRRHVVWAQMNGESITLTTCLDNAIDAEIARIKKNHGEPNIGTPSPRPGPPISI